MHRQPRAFTAVKQVPFQSAPAFGSGLQMWECLSTASLTFDFTMTEGGGPLWGFKGKDEEMSAQEWGRIWAGPTANLWESWC